MMIWEIWWAWITFGVVLAILEMFAPGFVFLGFALGAVAVGILMAIGIAFTLAWALLVFAIISVVVWIAMRKLIGVREGQTKVWDRDINDN